MAKIKCVGCGTPLPCGSCGKPLDELSDLATKQYETTPYVCPICTAEAVALLVAKRKEEKKNG